MAERSQLSITAFRPRVVEAPGPYQDYDVVFDVVVETLGGTFSRRQVVATLRTGYHVSGTGRVEPGLCHAAEEITLATTSSDGGGLTVFNYRPAPGDHAELARSFRSMTRRVMGEIFVKHFILWKGVTSS